jgi:hypothetical protein
MPPTKLNPNQVPISGSSTGIYPAGSTVQFWRGDNTWAIPPGTSPTVIVSGSSTLDANGTVTVTNSSTPTIDRIFLNCSSGNSNMTIRVTTVIAGVGFVITSLGGSDDAGLLI